jgi:hypothetical protein
MHKNPLIAEGIFYDFFRAFAFASLRPPGPYLLGHWGQIFADFARRYASSRESSSSSARCGGRWGLECMSVE